LALVPIIFAPLLAGCSMSYFNGGDKPATTGSIPAAVEVERPLPSSLAFSDAAKIGQAAKAALAQAQGAAAEDWVNVTTGSSGTIETVTLADPPGPANCRPFNTTVTSIGGVHEYSGALCEGGAGPRVRIDERRASDRS
jgi:17 kDa outer membrane surface antigen